MKRIVYLFVIAALTVLLASPAHVQDYGPELMKGDWCWACCKAYSGNMTLETFDDPDGIYNFKGKFSGAGGGDVTGKIEGSTVTFKRASDACTSGGNFQTWKGEISHDKKLGWVITGSLSGCNALTDPKIKANSEFLMRRTDRCEQ